MTEGRGPEGAGPGEDRSPKEGRGPTDRSPNDRGPTERRSEGDGPLTLRGAQEAVDAWIGGFEEGYWPPLANLARLVEEVGELARELNHLHGSKPKRPDEAETDLALELGDVLFVLIALANEQGINLEAGFRAVLEKYRRRDSTRWTPTRNP